MKIKNGLWWRAYCRTFLNEETQACLVEPPGNLCYFFWNGLAGMIQLSFDAIGRFFSSLNLLAALLLMAGSIALMVGSSYTLAYYEVGLAPSLIGAVSSLIFLGTTVFKTVIHIDQWLVRRWGEKFRDQTQTVCAWFFLWVMTSLALWFPPLTQMTKHVILFAPLIMVGMGLCILLVAGTILGVGWLFGNASTTDAWKVISAYVWAVKDRVCPLVEPPD